MMHLLLDQNGLTEQEFLKRYRPGDYERPSVAADIVIFAVSDSEEANYRKLPQKHLEVLLIKRGGHPFLGCYALPGGFVQPDETVGQAARRELWEETGVRDVYLEQLHTFSTPGRDPRTWVMSCAHMALIGQNQVSVQAGDDAEEAAWFRISFRMIRETKQRQDSGFVLRQQYELLLVKESQKLSAVVEYCDDPCNPNSEKEFAILSGSGLAFDHAAILAYAMKRLRKKTNASDIALHLMPERFSLTELQKVYEAILGKELIKAAFRRRIAGLVAETDEYTENAGHRPSRLYRRQ